LRVLSDPSKPRSVRELLDGDEHADYVYMYPPRQAYRALSPEVTRQFPDLVERSLAQSAEINLYVHVPFCRQICNFCNLYALNEGKDEFQHYVDTVLREATAYAALADRKQVASLYLGGGTPSLLSPAQVEQLVQGLLERFSRTPEHLPEESALEVDPNTVDVRKLRDFRMAGVNRINLGYQSFISAEVAALGRNRPEESGAYLLEQALSVGFANVCVDLIYGLANQTDASWQASVRQVAELGPETICAYALTLRPHTGYDRRGYLVVSGSTLRSRYAMASDILTDFGYRQETHVRWVRDGGGYLQKANHWALQNILGFGAGARSYLWHLDFRNGYSVRHRRSPLRAYDARVFAADFAADSGFLMSDDERRRKMAALNIQALDRHRFAQMFGTDPLTAFPEVLGPLIDAGVLRVDQDRIWIPPELMGDRDILAQFFFSPEVRRRIEEFNYDE
jgi:oxygen-independent coproporphyrinogen-3 oxidase